MDDDDWVKLFNSFSRPITNPVKESIDVTNDEPIDTMAGPLATTLPSLYGTGTGDFSEAEPERSRLDTVMINGMAIGSRTVGEVRACIPLFSVECRAVPGPDRLTELGNYVEPQLFQQIARADAAEKDRDAWSARCAELMTELDGLRAKNAELSLRLAERDASLRRAIGRR